MKIILPENEKKFAANTLFNLAIEAAQIGDRELHKNLMRLADQFVENRLVAELKKYQVQLLFDISSKLVVDLEMDIIPKIKPDNKDKMKTATELLETAKNLKEKLNSKL